ncbi:hypothetical protein ABZ807_19420 [Micromonospora sp. NPDC047548]|uniref:hypothetical protein n=1 Tax=Micromonospora sp. NPDC047548 TaxID=3155624 RepID=UPI0033F350A2
MLRRSKGALEVQRRTVGNALVLYFAERISEEAQALTMEVAADPEHDIVVLDMPGELPIGVWEAIGAALPRRRRPVRLVICGKEHEVAPLAGQWLAERLNRQVVAPHGRLIRGAAGAMLVHPGPGSGWVRYRPNRPPVWEAQRFPRPAWDQVVAESWPTSSTGVVDPLPGGAWIHDTRNDAAIARRREWLVTAVPCHPETLTVVLGCPGTPPLSTDDVARFWRSLDSSSRSRVRFARYGPVEPKGEQFWQTLADLLKSPIGCYTGIPMGSSVDPEVRTIDADGELGWQMFVRELRYLPRAVPTDKPALPTIVSHRPPLATSEQLSPMVYWYAPDAEVEVVQAGLWMRPVQAPRGADAVRARRTDPNRNTIIYEDGTARLATRMRDLAEDIVARLDPETRRRSQLLPASELLATVVRMPGPAGGQADDVQRHSFAPTVYDTSQSAEAETAVVEPERTVGAVPVAPTSMLANDKTVALRRDREPARTESVPFESVPPEPAQPVAVPTPVVSVVEPPSAAAGTAEQEVTPQRAALSAANSLRIRLPGRTAPPPPTDPGVVRHTTTPAWEPEAPASPSQPVPASTPVENLTPTRPVTAAAPVPDSPATDRAAVTRLQPVPEAAASALLSSRGLDDERGWLRKTLATDFDAMASALTRILSEHPGLQGDNPRTSQEILTDAVAVRLYLTSRGTAIDAGLRSGSLGPHVPAARCVVSGLNRLPSHRGATVFAASPTPEAWELLASRKVFTEWGFVNALTAPVAGQEGEVDVLIWSMTARRTRLLEPDGNEGVENRVLFVPGTSFKLLEVERGGDGVRGRILMRELATDEIDAQGRVDNNRASFDELAVASLRGVVERWAQGTPVGRIGFAAAPRFGALPGMV